MIRSKKLKELEFKITQMEMTVELLIGYVNDLMESKKMVIEEPVAEDFLQSSLDAGKWYTNPKETP